MRWFDPFIWWLCKVLKMTTKIKGTYKTQSLKVGWLAGDAVCVCALSVCNQLLMGWEGCLFSWVWVCVQVGNQWRGEMVISFLKLLPKLRFWEFHEILRCSIFPMAQKLKTLELDKIGHFCWKTCSLHKILKIYTSIVTYVFLSEKKNHYIHFLQFSFLWITLKLF